MHLPLQLTATGFALKSDNPLPVLSPRFLCSVTVVVRVTAGVPLSELTLRLCPWESPHTPLSPWLFLSSECLVLFPRVHIQTHSAKVNRVNVQEMHL